MDGAEHRAKLKRTWKPILGPIAWITLIVCGVQSFPLRAQEKIQRSVANEAAPVKGAAKSSKAKPYKGKLKTGAPQLRYVFSPELRSPKALILPLDPVAINISSSPVYLELDSQKRAEERAAEEKNRALIQQSKFDSAHSFPKSTPSNFPLLESHSTTSIIVAAGNAVQLRAIGVQTDLQYIWVRNQEVLCKSFECRVMTHGWELGNHIVTLIAYNNDGALRLPYEIRTGSGAAIVRARRDEIPLMVPYTGGGDRLYGNQLYAQLLRGHSFLHRITNTITVPPFGCAIAWNEVVTTDTQGVMVFGAPEQDEHYLLEKGRLRIRANSAGHRQIFIERGKLRSRNLKMQDPAWTIMVGDWLQIDTDQRGDVVVEKLGDDDEEKIVITSLRGYARIIYTSDQGSNSTATRPYDSSLADRLHVSQNLIQEQKKFTIVTLSPGTSTLLNRINKSKVKVKAAKAASSSDVVMKTTPEIFLSEYWTKYKRQPFEESIFANIAIVERDNFNRRFQTLISPDQKPKDLREAIILADKALQDRDYLIALEALLPFFKGENIKSYGISLRIGQAMLGLHNYRLAYPYLLLAHQANRKSPEPVFYLGLWALETKSWEMAKEKFAFLAQYKSSLDENRLQELHYYRGVSYYFAGNPYLANAAFSKSLFWDKDQTLGWSAREFIKAYEQERHGYRLIGFYLLHDSNIYRVGSSEKLPSESTDRSSPVVMLDLDLFRKLLNTPQEELLIGIRASPKYWTKPAITYLKSDLYLGFGLKFFDDQRLENFRVNLSPFLGTIRYDNAGVDGFGVDLSLTAAKWPTKPRALLHLDQYLDISLGQTAILGPLTGEPTVMKLQGARSRKLQLSFNLFEDEKKVLVSELSRNELQHRHLNSRVDDFVSYGLAFDGNLQFLQEFRGILRASAEKRQYPASDNDRRDAMWQMTAEMAVFFSNTSKSGLYLEYTTNQSSLSERSYQRILSGIRGLLDL